MATAAASMAIMADISTIILSEEASFSSTPSDDRSHAASLSSTPPTTVSPDSMSLASEPDIAKSAQLSNNDVYVSGAAIEAVIPMLETQSEQQLSGQQSPPEQDAIVVAQPLPAINFLQSSRSRRARASLPVYNLSKLSGGSAGLKHRAKGGNATEKRRRTISGDTALNVSRKDTEGRNTPKGARTSSRTKAIPAVVPVTRRATRRSGTIAETLATKLAALTKGKKKSAKMPNIPRELQRLQDTNEFAHIDTRPVRYTVWSNGKYVDVADDPAAVPAPEPPRKKTKVAELGETIAVETSKEEKKDEVAPAKPSLGPFSAHRTRQWHKKGLYAGQEAPTDLSVGLTAAEKKALAAIPELAAPVKPNKTMPLPMYNGLRTLITGRDFKLPFDVCNPTPPGHPKPPPYRTLTKNRFVGDAAAYWKKSPHFDDFSSKCVCKPEDGCAEDCQNRIMLYECDETNCNAGKGFCTNRAFQDLQERTKKGGPYRVGVEVVKTENRGFGVRSNRGFKANQIIMEYTGEIITDNECDRRMNEKYKDNECYYLMSFDQNMIIDATTGSMARFVNHSCSPNCRMIKWIVSGQPRMALFAGDSDITTGEELTYDYNFDPFSAKNVQKCLCGSANCRGVLGPKPKEVKMPKVPKEDKKSAKGAAKGGKRKLAELLAGSNDEESVAKPAKKVKVQPAAGLQRTVSAKTLKAVKSAAKGATTLASNKFGTIKSKKAAVKVAAKRIVKVAAKGKGKVVTLMAAKKIAVKSITKAAPKGAPAAGKRTSKTISLGAQTALKSYKGSSESDAEPTASSSRAAGPGLGDVANAGLITNYFKKPLPKIVFSSNKMSPVINVGFSTLIQPDEAEADVAPAKPAPAKSSPKTNSARSTPKPTAAPASALELTGSGRKRLPSRKVLEASTPDAGNTPALATSSVKPTMSRATGVRVVSSTVAV